MIIEKNRLLLFDPSDAIGIITDQLIISELYSAIYCSTWYVVGRPPIASSPINIFAGGGDVATQINRPGTAAQTSIVRIISQTAVIFSTIDSIQFYLGI